MENWTRSDGAGASSAHPHPSPEQRNFGLPGASLFTATALGEDARIAGIEGERIVGAELERLAAQYQNTYVFHSVKLPGAIGDIDHLVVQGNRILLVDSKNWKSGPDYRVSRSDRATDHITRDGEEFVGGTIHLPRQMRQWAKEFAGYDVQGALVLSNPYSSVLSDVGPKLRYVFANIDGLPEVFAHRFAPAGAPVMDPALLARLRDMLQAPPAPRVVPAPRVAPARNSVGVPALTLAELAARLLPTTAPAKRAPKSVIWAVVWCALNWALFTLTPLYAFVGISVVPQIFFVHWQRGRVRRAGSGGSGLLVGVLIFSYYLLALCTHSAVGMILSGS